MNVVVIGATGGSGRAAVRELLALGHEVSAFSRSAGSLKVEFAGVRTIEGDAMSPEAVDRAVAGQDAVVVTLGISEDAVRVRLRGSSATPMDVRSAGTRNVIAAMQKHGLRRLVVQTAFGVGETRKLLPLQYRLMYSLILAPQIADTAIQEQLVRKSGLDWVLVQPVSLTDSAAKAEFLASTDGATLSMHVSRAQVGQLLARAVQEPGFVRRTVSVSGGQLQHSLAPATV